MRAGGTAYTPEVLRFATIASRCAVAGLQQSGIHDACDASVLTRKLDRAMVNAAYAPALEIPPVTCVNLAVLPDQTILTAALPNRSMIVSEQG
jgi:hypothetical protein